MFTQHDYPQRVQKRHRMSPLLFLGAGTSLLLLLIASTVFVLPHIATHAANANMDCTLIVPPNPLSAQGLATPYQLVATNPANGPCNEANANQAAFVQGAVLDPATGAISVYNPLVVDKGTQPAVQPTVPQLPANAVVGLWFGFNGANLTLQGMNGSKQQARCVNGANGSLFGQFAYCNAIAFFAAANRAIGAGQLTPPALGMANDGKPCPTVRDFSVVDMDQSDNVTTSYIVTANGQTAQMTAANTAALQNTQTQVNGSDNRLLSIALDGALGCTPWQAPDLADPGHMAPALPLNELQAAARQAAPVAIVPQNDPMALNNNNPDRAKLNAYRLGVDQPISFQQADRDTKTYCTNMLNIAPARTQLDAQFTKNRPSPDAAAANSLFTFLAQRFSTAFGPNGLNCTGLLNQANPITLQKDGNGVVIDATINVPGGNGGNGNGGGTPPPLTCNVNGTALTGCTGTATLNGQSCNFTLNDATNQLNITCPAQQQGNQQKGQ